MQDNINIIDLGDIFIGLAKEAPGGVLLFFSSKSHLKKVMDVWFKSKIKDEVNWFIEGTDKFDKLVENYEK